MSAFNQLLPELVFLIAARDELAWYMLYRFSEQFHKYAITDTGRRKFIELFTWSGKMLVDINSWQAGDADVTLLFGKKHSIYDNPGATYIDNCGRIYNIWYYHDVQHRAKLPASISTCDDNYLKNDWYTALGYNERMMLLNSIKRTNEEYWYDGIFLGSYVSGDDMCQVISFDDALMEAWNEIHEP